MEWIEKFSAGAFCYLCAIVIWFKVSKGFPCCWCVWNKRTVHALAISQEENNWVLDTNIDEALELTQSQATKATTHQIQLDYYIIGYIN